jgi:hypothetical protein
MTGTTVGKQVWADFASNGPWPGPVISLVHNTEADAEGHIGIQAPDGFVHQLGPGDGTGDTGRTFWEI